MKKVFVLILAACLFGTTALAQSASLPLDEENEFASFDEDVVEYEILEGMPYRQIKKIYDFHDWQKADNDPYSPWGAGICSFVIPGLGQIINGEVGIGAVLLILAWTVVGMLGSYSVAAYGIRMNTLANSRMAFASLRRNPLNLLNIPLSAGMSIGVVLICVELLLMLVILLLMPAELAGACFIGFAIGESLGASALRIAGGIFTKIADIGSDLMKVVFKIGEDDPRNPGVIADCTGDNAGDSIGPTADGFETYGVTGVALVSFILLAIPDTEIQRQLLVWIFTMRILGIVTSVIAYYINNFVSKLLYGKKARQSSNCQAFIVVVLHSAL